MTDLPEHPRRLRELLQVTSRRLLPWARRAELDQTARALQIQIESLEGLVKSALQSGHANEIRWDHLDNHLVQMSSDLTAMIGSHLAENAASHDLLGEQVADAEAVLGALTQSLAPLLGGIVVDRSELHRALAWYPTWSALAPLTVEPLISVVVPTRNRRSLLEAALASLTRQTYTNWEAVVVNDGSTDDTGEFLRHLSIRDGRFRFIEAGGLGCGGARQHGFEHAHGEVLAYLDDDNLMSEGWLRAVVEVLGRQPDLGAVYGAQLREVNAAEPWLLLEPFDELRLLEGNFIDIGAFAHRQIGGVRHRDDIQGLEDWDFILSVSEVHTPVPLPVIASIYLTGARGRLTLASDHSADEELVRSSAVRRRLDDAGFVERSIRSVVRHDQPSDTGSANLISTSDVEMLLNIVRSISQRRDGPVWILEWGTSHNSESARQQLRDVDLHWLRMRDRVGLVGDPFDSTETEWSGPRFDASKADAHHVRESLAESPHTEVWFDLGPGTTIEDFGTSHSRAYVLLPKELGIDFDFILIDGPAQRECLRQAREIVSSTGLVLLRGPDPSWHDTHVDEFTSWRPIGDSFWVGSTVDTDFTDVVPIRGLLRGMRRTRQHAETPATH